MRSDTGRRESDRFSRGLKYCPDDPASLRRTTEMPFTAEHEDR
jgi:hypothetical protein